MKNSLDIARNMLADGLPIDKISRYTELSYKEVEELKAKQEV